MKRPFVKFCGFRRAEDVQLASRLPVDALGFILVPGRRRTVTREDLPDLIRYVSPAQMAIGVLQNPTWEEVKSWLKLVPFSGIQLHGEESAAFCRKLKSTFSVHVTKVIHIQEQADPMEELEVYRPWVDAILLDKEAGNIRGGTGQSFAWDSIPSWKESCRKAEIPLWIAGGINEANVVDLIKHYQPDGIDVSSGIEKNQQKDGATMRLFIERVEKACQQ
ncbi:phosphoribosylanthranilate isomerase [Thermoactinomyces mirandus]|uniref:N-(5'-phosphoribosyl)anthranilate isomerase n=1 Tax=Thermoactinomyces mirandus TaxID=2756294 RepID=A0A7W2ASD2_9BACL|nr:phosphoribosylanthranilate isomerase [Thermoactinomyces mirandus]MBA4602555.1 phosphoribosylanthranilate isomerase [Thermoactinomyces mirandus]